MNATENSPLTDNLAAALAKDGFKPCPRGWMNLRNEAGHLIARVCTDDNHLILHLFNGERNEMHEGQVDFMNLPDFAAYAAITATLNAIA